MVEVSCVSSSHCELVKIDLRSCCSFELFRDFNPFALVSAPLLATVSDLRASELDGRVESWDFGGSLGGLRRGLAFDGLRVEAEVIRETPGVSGWIGCESSFLLPLRASFGGGFLEP